MPRRGLNIITIEQARKYRENPDYCPFCGSEEIEGQEFDFETESRQVICFDCKETWQDVYSITGIANEDFTSEFVFEEIEEHTVDLIASGYEWTCPKCETVNHEIEVLGEVTCDECKRKFTSDIPQHAYP